MTYVTSDIRVLPYKLASRSARAIARAIGCRRLYPDERSRYRGRASHTVINWGSSSLPPSMEESRGTTIINDPACVKLTANKILTFQALEGSGVDTVEYTTEQSTAQQWADNGDQVVCRQYVGAHSGRGIILVEPGDTVPMAPLYTKYFRKTAEFRVHVGSIDGDYFVIDFAQKKRTHRVPDEEVNWQIRNHNNGWIFARQDVTLPDSVAYHATEAVKHLGLTFAAVDMLHHNEEDKARVCEINSAPGLEGTTLERYTEYFNQLLRR